MLTTQIVITTGTCTTFSDALNIEKAKKIVCFMERLSADNFSGWIRINFHEGHLSSKIEYGSCQSLV